jgi:hypothetical protein
MCARNDTNTNSDIDSAPGGLSSDEEFDIDEEFGERSSSEAE